VPNINYATFLNPETVETHLLYRVFQKELYNFESL
jgi:hypothetical protein